MPLHWREHALRVGSEKTHGRRQGRERGRPEVSRKPISDRRRSHSHRSGPHSSTASASARSETSSIPSEPDSRSSPSRAKRANRPGAVMTAGCSSRLQVSHCPTERDEVAARGGRDRDDSRQALDVVCRRSVVPDDGSRSRLGYLPRAVTPVRPEHEAVAAGYELLVYAAPPAPAWIRRRLHLLGRRRAGPKARFRRAPALPGRRSVRSAARALRPS